tara:strand:+ start:483 stop:842 length:360 start_codon:yes stop_codon:yes gene_type:complete
MTEQEFSDLKMTVALVFGLASDNLINTKSPFKKSDILGELWWRFFNTSLDRSLHVERANGDENYKLCITKGLKDSLDKYLEEPRLVTIEELDKLAIEKLVEIMNKIDDSGDAFGNYMII